jgi:regulator of nucleoside diphosphate kinase
MTLSTRITSASDVDRLRTAVDRALSSWLTYAPYLNFFRSELRRARPVATSDVPSDVITMHSRFALRDDNSDERVCYTLVFPEDEAVEQGKISVLSPMGMALYGARVGDEVSWMSSAGPRAATITQLFFQPEAAGQHAHASRAEETQAFNQNDRRRRPPAERNRDT